MEPTPELDSSMPFLWDRRTGDILGHFLSVWTPPSSLQCQGSSGAHPAENPQAWPIKYIQAQGGPTAAPTPDTQAWATQPLTGVPPWAGPLPSVKLSWIWLVTGPLQSLLKNRFLGPLPPEKLGVRGPGHLQYPKASQGTIGQKSEDRVWVRSKVPLDTVGPRPQK